MCLGMVSGVKSKKFNVWEAYHLNMVQKKKNGRFLGKINILKNFFKLAATLHIHIF